MPFQKSILSLHNVRTLPKAESNYSFAVDVHPSPINEFDFSCLASLAFVKLFPLGQADPSRKGRHTAVTEQEASSHLLKYAERDPCIAPPDEKPDGKLYYPFAEHSRFSFWMADSIRRQRALGQSKFFLKQNPVVNALTMDDLKDMIRSGAIEICTPRLPT